MILLTTTSDVLKLITSSTSQLEYYVGFVDITTSAFTPSNSSGVINTATTTTIVSSPASSTQRQIKLITVRNVGTETNTVTFDFGNGVDKELYKVSMSAGDSIQYTNEGGFQISDANGLKKVVNSVNLPVNGISQSFLKIGTATEAAGVRYAFAKDSGFPGAYSLGTPGLNGFWVDGSVESNATNPVGAAQISCSVLLNASIGWYLTGITISSSAVSNLEVIDVMWYNTGAVVTTTGAQAITMPASLARDANGGTTGFGLQAAILVTAATTNAGAVTNMTLSYTNTAGTPGRTATIASFPATAVIGTFVQFQLASGDVGIQSIQSITLGTSLVTGSVSLVLYRPIAAQGLPLANNIAAASSLNLFARVFNKSALWILHTGNATTAATIAGTINLVDR